MRSRRACSDGVVQEHARLRGAKGFAQLVALGADPDACRRSGLLLLQHVVSLRRLLRVARPSPLQRLVAIPVLWWWYALQWLLRRRELPAVVCHFGGHSLFHPFRLCYALYAPGCAPDPEHQMRQLYHRQYVLRAVSQLHLLAGGHVYKRAFPRRCCHCHRSRCRYLLLRRLRLSPDTAQVGARQEGRETLSSGDCTPSSPRDVQILGVPQHGLSSLRISGTKYSGVRSCRWFLWLITKAYVRVVIALCAVPQNSTIFSDS